MARPMIARIVYETGLEVHRLPEGDWYFPNVSPSGVRPTADPELIPRKYKVRPVLITKLLADETRRTLLLVANRSERSLVFAVHITDFGQFLHRQPSTMTKAQDIVYLLGAVEHHCRRLAESYSSVCHIAARIESHRSAEWRCTTFGFGSHPEPWYEFDALVSAIRRTYETLRFLLWNVFGPGGGGVPRSFDRTLCRCTELPEQLKERLEGSWQKYGLKLKAYRDCVHHNAQLEPFSSAQMLQLENGAWTTRIRIPDNPEAKSESLFRWSSRLDALQYGWGAANEILEVTRCVVHAVNSQHAHEPPKSGQ